MNTVEKLFLRKAINRVGILLYSKRNALDFIQEYRKKGVQLLGIDGFYLTGNIAQPSMIIV